MARLYYQPGPAAPNKVFLATISYERPDESYTYSIQASRTALKEAGIESEYLLLCGNCHVDDARNSVIAEFLLSDCQSIVFLDADVSWQAGDLVTLCQYDLEFVGAVYPYRREDKKGEMPFRPKPEAVEKDGLLEVLGLPAGFMRISRLVIIGLALGSEKYDHNGKEVPLLFQRTLIDGTRWGGDLHVCRLWTQAGGEIYAATEIRLGHVAKTVRTDSLGAYMRRIHGTTLKYVAAKIKDGTETPSDIDEILQAVDNPWGMNATGLMTALAMARKAKRPILEMGSGLSTILMAAATDQTVYCLEHSQEFAKRVAELARAARVTNIGICVAPIVGDWYDPREFDGLPSEFDFAVVDGPNHAAGKRTGFFDHFDAQAILVDDTDEPEYARFLLGWAEQNDRDIMFPDPRTALIRKRNRKEQAA